VRSNFAGCALLVLRLDYRSVQQMEGVSAVLMCVDCLATCGHGTGPLPRLDPGGDGASLDLLPTWGLETQGGRQPSGHRGHAPAVGAGEQVARMYQEPRLAWLERQAKVAEDPVAERQTATRHAE
jgi:hypothetical protein